LLIDEDTQAKELVLRLRRAGHDVITVPEANLAGEEDDLVLDYARRERRILLTRNCEDFKTLHDSGIAHLGILAIYQDHDPAKRMSYAAVVRAVANVEATGLDLTGLFLSLNAWDY
jgi:hypothetical protein